MKKEKQERINEIEKRILKGEQMIKTYKYGKIPELEKLEKSLRKEVTAPSNKDGKSDIAFRAIVRRENLEDIIIVAMREGFFTDKQYESFDTYARFENGKWSFPNRQAYINKKEREILNKFEDMFLELE